MTDTEEQRLWKIAAKAAGDCRSSILCQIENRNCRCRRIANAVAEELAKIGAGH